MSDDMEFRRPLTDAEMEKVIGAVGSCQRGCDAFVAGLVAFWDIALLEAHGVALSEMEESFSPWKYAIPESQWGEIAQTISRRAGQDGIESIGQTNQMMDWMNKGPSAYDLEAADVDG